MKTYQFFFLMGITLGYTAHAESQSRKEYTESSDDVIFSRSAAGNPWHTPITGLDSQERESHWGLSASAQTPIIADGIAEKKNIGSPIIWATPAPNSGSKHNDAFNTHTSYSAPLAYEWDLPRIPLSELKVSCSGVPLKCTYSRLSAEEAPQHRPTAQILPLEAFEMLPLELKDNKDNSEENNC